MRAAAHQHYHYGSATATVMMTEKGREGEGKTGGERESPITHNRYLASEQVHDAWVENVCMYVVLRCMGRKCVYICGICVYACGADSCSLAHAHVSFNAAQHSYEAALPACVQQLQLCESERLAAMKDVFSDYMQSSHDCCQALLSLFPPGSLSL